MLRTHTCGELNSRHIGQEVILSGWINSYRDLGGLIFIDLRDRYGLTQAKFNVEVGDKGTLKVIQEVRNEWVVQIIGKIEARPRETINKEIATGEIEVIIKKIKVLNSTKQMPFELNEDKSQEANESLRLKYRFLDLRRKKLQNMLKTKDEVITYIRSYFHRLDFWEIQTPILANSSPEGARDFLVPSRLYPGKFFALPQAPQQFKQLLMVGGLDKYFQIAPCFRDEDPRMDRHYGEFYQLDMEMSFVEQDDILQVMEPLLKELTEKFSDKKIIKLKSDGRFLQIPWKEAINRFGIDKPDLRFSLEIQDISNLIKNCGFKIIDKALNKDGVAKAINISKGAAFSRKEIDEIIEVACQKGAPGLSYIILKDKKINSSLVKFLDTEKVARILKKVEAKDGDLVFIIAGPWRQSCEALGAVREHCARKLNLKDNRLAAFVWIVDFPMYEYSELEEGRIDFGHNPFPMPQGGMDALKTKNPLDILAYQFDLVLNGFEISSGAIRNHSPEIMYEAFKVAGYSREEVDKNFSAMISAFSYGAPPHGGNAPGLDRLIMVLNDWNSIRDIYAFPKDSQGKDLMTGAPCEVKDKQLEELSVKIVKEEIKKKKN
jgi:aspartyl-tRNA synthetase